MAKCKQCGKEYEPKRSTSDYCGPKCKQAYYRNRMRNTATVTPTELVTVTPAKSNTKRGVDIKTFEDLPLDVQHSIEVMSKDAEDRAKRTARAVHYQHLFPYRYNSTGQAIKPVANLS